jgi:enoyl-CoA hydratase/carnithine racemase
VLVTGSDGVFTAGNDINDFLSQKGDIGSSPALRFIKALARFEKPLVAAVDGLAIGIGTTMLLHCDLVYASPEAILKVPFVDLGLTPEGGSSVLMPRRFGMARASELLLLGEAISAERAERFGLVNAIVPAPDLHRHALEKAKALAQKPPKALAAARKMLRGDMNDLPVQMDKEGREFAMRLAMPEARAAFLAFTQRDRQA